MARIVEGSMGSFLDPPGSAQYDRHVEEGPRDNPNSLMSLRGALDAEWLPDGFKSQVQAILNAQNVECTEEWLQEVYRHFRHCYSPDGENRRADACIIDKENNLPIERHLAVLYVRQWFPAHEPRTDLL